MTKIHRFRMLEILHAIHAPHGHSHTHNPGAELIVLHECYQDHTFHKSRILVLPKITKPPKRPPLKEDKRLLLKSPSGLSHIKVGCVYWKSSTASKIWLIVRFRKMGQGNPSDPYKVGAEIGISRAAGGNGDGNLGLYQLAALMTLYNEDLQCSILQQWFQREVKHHKPHQSPGKRL